MLEPVGRNDADGESGRRRRAPVTRKVANPRKRLRPPRLLTYVDAVARHGSIRKAADALNVASSALNRQILDLETDLGAALFERLPRGVRLTAAGEVFLAYARQAISELKAVESQVEQLRGLVRGQVGIAAVESVAGELLPIGDHPIPGRASERPLQCPHRRARGTCFRPDRRSSRSHPDAPPAAAKTRGDRRRRRSRRCAR